MDALWAMQSIMNSDIASKSVVRAMRDSSERLNKKKCGRREFHGHFPSTLLRSATSVSEDASEKGRFEPGLLAFSEPVHVFRELFSINAFT